MPRIDEVFKKSGVPTYTFVAPLEYERVKVALQTPGRGVIIEGPSGIGKTSCIQRVLQDVSLFDSCLFLSARKASDIELIKALPTLGEIDTVVIDDFHRLEPRAKQKLSDFAKTLADDEDAKNKLILIGINRAGQTLVEYSPDLLHRVETIRFGHTSLERITQLIELGEKALNCQLDIKEEIANEAEGSFAMAQVLCHEACLQAKLLETNIGTTPQIISVSLPYIREHVLTELRPRFFPWARKFATGKKLRRGGRAPYLHLLLWLSQTKDGVLDTKEAIATNPDLKGSVGQVIEKGHLLNLISDSEEVSNLIHFEPSTQLLTAEDPKLLYFIRHLIWPKFAKQVGFSSIDFKSKYDFALSFAGENRNFAEELSRELESREISVFYDKNEQHKILANNIEEYLAPIYRSESHYIVPILSNDYSTKLWTKFESDNFKDRFGENLVIPIWYSDTHSGLFDETRKYGGLTFDPTAGLQEQVCSIAEVLSKKLEEERSEELRASLQPTQLEIDTTIPS